MSRFTDELSGALAPHTVALGGHVQGINDLLRNIYEAIVASGPNRPGADTHWQYNNLSAAGAVVLGDFNIPVVVPKNEIWLLQAIIVDTASVNVQATTDGGQLRGAYATTAAGGGTQTIGGDIGWLPGEHIVVTTSAACVVTFAVLRQIIAHKMPRVPIGQPSNEMVAGRSNTHDPARDNLDQKGIYAGTPRETRASEGTERNPEPVVLVPDNTYATVDPTSV
ncbi:MAG: hypothetical protein ABSF18_07710 [Gammaproteobacteria bacterium]|jgi:hypothetical protein